MPDPGRFKTAKITALLKTQPGKQEDGIVY
jgi:hypothetical protein